MTSGTVRELVWYFATHAQMKTVIVNFFFISRNSEAGYEMIKVFALVLNSIARNTIW